MIHSKANLERVFEMFLIDQKVYFDFISSSSSNTLILG